MKYNQAKTYILEKLKGLSSDLHYHSVKHTLDVLNSINVLIEYEGLDGDTATMLRTAALMHDTGFLEVYQNHEEKGCEYAKEWLPQFNYSKDQIAIICGMIMATKIPHQPRTHLEQMICDADLDYLGRNDYDEISELLYLEWQKFGMVTGNKEWLEKQIGFLNLHKYYTDYSILKRRPQKLMLLQNLRSDNYLS